MKEKKQDNLVMARNIITLRKRGVKINDIMKAFGLTYGEYKKLEQMGQGITNKDVDLMEKAVNIAEPHSKEELFALSYYLMQLALFR